MSAISDQVADNFQRLPPEEQEMLRELQTDPEVQKFISIMSKVLPPEVLEGLPGLRAPQNPRGPRQRGAGGVRGLLSHFNANSVGVSRTDEFGGI